MYDERPYQTHTADHYRKSYYYIKTIFLNLWWFVVVVDYSMKIQLMFKILSTNIRAFADSHNCDIDRHSFFVSNENYDLEE